MEAETEHSATETGQYGHRWRLTEAGTAALKRVTRWLPE